MLIKIALAAAALIAILSGVCYYQAGQLRQERQEKSALADRLKGTMEAITAADKETAKLTARIAELRRQATAKEDKINAAIHSTSKTDPCLDRRIDPSILNGLRGTPAGK